MTDHKDIHEELREAQAEIERLKSDLYHAIQALHCSAPYELSVQEIRALLEIRNISSDKYKEAT